MTYTDRSQGGSKRWKPWVPNDWINLVYQIGFQLFKFKINGLRYQQKTIELNFNETLQLPSP